MGSSRAAPDAFTNMNAKRDELIRDHFEPQLARIGLSVEQIENQILDELNQSLIKVNDCISHPEGFGTLRIKINASAGLILVQAQQEAHLEVGILPILLERKSLILMRIKILAGDKKVEELNNLVASVSDQELREKIKSELTMIADQSRRLAEQESAVNLAQAEQIAKRDEALTKLRAELFERRLRAWTGFFARESMATYIGAFILILLTFVQIFAMFSEKTDTSEIINNAFLLILGYFFGQGVARTPPGPPGTTGGA